MNVLIILSFIFQPTLCDYDRRVVTTLNHSRSRPDVALTIVNGEPAGNGQVPYLVSLKEPIHKYEEGKVAWKNLCGGSIIDATRILTAAHCFEASDFYFAKRPDLLRVVAGNLRNSLIHTGDSETTDDAQWRQLKKVIIHPEFHFPNNDIAVGHVDERWSFTELVQPIKLASASTDYNSKCVAAGYGRVGPDLRDAISPVLLVAQIAVLTRSECSLLWEMDMNNFVCSETSVTDVARGDSGGPLVCSESDPLRETQDDVLVGVVSGKNYDKTSLYTRVSAYRDWIMNADRGAPSARVSALLVWSLSIYAVLYYVFIYHLIRFLI